MFNHPLMDGTKRMEKNKNVKQQQSFFKEYLPYFIVAGLFALLTYWYFWLATIADLTYVWQYILQMFQLKFDGQIIPYEELTRLEQGYSSIFGPQYDAIAPEIIRAFEERQHLLPYVFLAEFILFAVMLVIQGGRKGPKIRKNVEMISVHSMFQRVVLLGNILIMIYLFITGFSITFGNVTGGAALGFFMRQTHEMVGLVWIPVWLLVTVIAFKDHKYFIRPSVKLSGFFLKGLYTHGQRINYFAYVAFGFILCFSGFWIYYLTPDFAPYAQIIQYKRLILFGHFMGSAVITFFVGETIYSYVVAIRGYLPGLITGKYPKEYLEEFHPEILEGK